MTHYVVGYFDAQHNHFDVEVDAENVWDAQHVAAETNTYLNEHPHSIESIVKEN